MKQKGFAPILIVIIIAALVGGYLLYRNQVKPISSLQPQNPVVTPQAPKWRLELSVSGGFQGVMQTVSLSSDGQLVAVDSRTDKQVTTYAPEKSLMEVAGQVASLSPSSLPAPPRDRILSCPDCFVYALTVHQDGKVKDDSYRLDDSSLGGSGLEKLIGELISLRDLALAGKLP